VLKEPSQLFNLYLLPNRACSPGSGFALVAAMKLSGFSFIRNANAWGRPFVPAFRSLLPLGDEIVVNLLRSAAGSLDMVRSGGLTLGRHKDYRLIQ
jgi:hypothetical protein